MKKFNLVLVTTFRKHIEVEANSEEEAIDLVSNDTDIYDSATETLDFDSEVKIEENNSSKGV